MNLIDNLLATELHTENRSQRIYSASFHNREVAQLPSLLKSLEAVLIDIRFIPENQPLKWSKEYLKLLLKNKYLHVPSLGNRSSVKGKIAIQNISLGIKIITELKVNVLLFCRCKENEICHRETIANELKNKQGIQVIEISL